MHRERGVAQALLLVATAVTACGFVVGIATISHNGVAGSWRPTATGVAGAKQIAAHVRASIHLDDPRARIEIWTSSTRPLETLVLFADGRRRAVDVADQVLHTLCGPGGVVGCSLADRRPWHRCALEIRRWALELAATTFTHLATVDMVVVGWPTHERLAGFSVFERGDFPERRIRALLGFTGDDAIIDRFTRRRSYALSGVVPQPDGSLNFVLDQLSCPLPPSRY